jgi:hypothetical protein
MQKISAGKFHCSPSAGVDSNGDGSEQANPFAEIAKAAMSPIVHGRAAAMLVRLVCFQGCCGCMAQGADGADPQLLTHCGHGLDRYPAAQQSSWPQSGPMVVRPV